MATDLTEACQSGYALGENASNPHLFSSDNWLAFRAGQLVYGCSGVVRCRKSRGYSVVLTTPGRSEIRVTFKGDKLDQHLLDRR